MGKQSVLYPGTRTGALPDLQEKPMSKLRPPRANNVLSVLPRKWILDASLIRYARGDTKPVRKLRERT
jgi:hypothetical protein